MDPGQHWLVHLITTNIFQWNVIENAIVLIRVNAFKISSTEGGHSVQAPLYQICMSAAWTPVRFGWIPVLMHTLHDIYTAESAKHWSLCCITDGNNAKPHMMTSSNGLFMRGIHRSPVNSQHKGQWRGSLDAFLDLRLNQRLNKQWRRRWFATQSRLLWRHCNEL